jgi:hypothetical protein
MFLRCIFAKQRIQPRIGGCNLFTPVFVSKNGRSVGLRNRAQNNNTEKKRCNYFMDAGIGFIFLAHAVKIMI